jgi:broad specificity phosphatase PhoE
MLRLTLLAAAPTEAHRLYRFPADEPIEPVPPIRVKQILSNIGATDQVICGPERRSLETAALLGRVATTSENVQAWSAGNWSGQALDWVAANDPEGLRSWQADPDAAPHGGETLNTLLARLGRWLDEHTSTSGRWLVVADASAVRAIVVHVLAAPPASFWRLDIPPLSLSVVQYAGSQWRLRSLALDPEAIH